MRSYCPVPVSIVVTPSIMGVIPGSVSRALPVSCPVPCTPVSIGNSYWFIYGYLYGSTQDIYRSIEVTSIPILVLVALVRIGLCAPMDTE